MTHRVGAFGLFEPNGKQNPLVFDAILVFVVCVLAIALAVAFVSLVLPQANVELMPGGSPGPGINLARWSALGQLSLPNDQGDQGPGAAQASELAEAFARSLALTGQGWTGLLGDPSSAPIAAQAP